MVIKKQYWALLRSKRKTFDFFQLLYAWLFRPRHLFISSRIKFTNKGKITASSPLYFGIFSNRLNASPSEKGVFELLENAIVKIGSQVKISSGCKIYVNGNFEIGNNTLINPNTFILANYSVKIGQGCAISWNCQIMDDDVHQISVDGKPKPTLAAIEIGDKVWIGSHCIIMKGVTIGNGAVIAAGSVVTKSIPPGCLAGGAPAEVLRENIEWKP